MSNPSYTRRSVPVDSKRGDWPRLVADDLNSIVRAYMFAFDFADTPGDGAVLCTHPCAANFSIPADWGEMVTEGHTEYAGFLLGIDFDNLPVSDFDITVDVQRKWETDFNNIGYITIFSDGTFTAITTDGKQQDIVKRDVLRFTGPATADAAAMNMGCTIIGMR